jgi:hypothetical protein
VKQIFNLWSKRDLTILGRTQVVKTLALAKLWYVATVTTPPRQIMADINKNIWDFIWGKNRQAVARGKWYKSICVWEGESE